MLWNSHNSKVAKRRQTLAKVYILLVRLADSNGKAANVQPLDGDTLTAKQDNRQGLSSHDQFYLKRND